LLNKCDIQPVFNSKINQDLYKLILKINKIFLEKYLKFNAKIDLKVE
jgi:hypothetical protein